MSSSSWSDYLALGNPMGVFPFFNPNGRLGILVLSIYFETQTIVIVSLLTLLTNFEFQLV
jgi:hypothetical protein